MKVKTKLIVMQFMQFAVMGSYILSLGGYLASKGLGTYIGTFYAIGGFVSLVTPTLVGIIADRHISAQKLYGFLHLILTAALLAFAFYGKNRLCEEHIGIGLLLFGLVQALYLPTIPLSYSIVFALLKQQKLDPTTNFPVIRTFGTVGFVIAMVMVDILNIDQSYSQFFQAAVLSVILSALALSLPDCPPSGKAVHSRVASFTALFKVRELAVFFGYALCIGIIMKTGEAYTNPFFTDFGLEHPNILISLSRISETFCLLLIPLCLRKMGIKRLFLVSLLAWMVYYGGLATGNITNSYILFVVSMLSYGLSFDFSFTAGAMYIDRTVPAEFRSTAQGLLTLLTNGVGSLIGASVAQRLFNQYVYQSVEHNWSAPWFMVTAFGGLVFLLMALMFHPKK